MNVYLSEFKKKTGQARVELAYQGFCTNFRIVIGKYIIGFVDVIDEYTIILLLNVVEIYVWL